MAFRLATLKLGVPPLAFDLPPGSVLCPEKMISKSSCHLLRMLGEAIFFENVAISQARSRIRSWVPMNLSFAIAACALVQARI